MKVDLENWHYGYSQILMDCRGGGASSYSDASAAGSCLILCNADVDAVAAGRILCYMLRNDGVSYQILPCRSYSQLQQRIRAQETSSSGGSNSELRAVVLLNLGASRNLTALFENDNGSDDDTETALLDPDTCKVYVMDCRRPVHLANIHASQNICVFWDHVQDEEALPSDGDNLSGDESSSSSSSSSSEEGDSADEGENEFGMEDDEGEAEFGQDEQDNPDENTPPPDNDDDDDDALPQDPMLDVGQEQETDYDGEDEHEAKTDDDDDKQQKLRKDPTQDTADDEDSDDDMSIGGTTKKKGRDDTTTQTTTATGETATTATAMMTPRELHQDRRNRLRQYYASGSFYGSPAAYTAYMIARQMRFGEIGDLLWLACVGVTDAYLQSRLDLSGYTTLAVQLKGICHGLFPNDDFSRVTNTVYSEHLLGDNNNNNNGQQQQHLTRIGFSGNGNILTENDFRFFLLRHTSLFDAMVYSDYISTKFQLSTQRGMHKLQEMLAKMGYPLEQCQQPFAFMNPTLRRQLKEKFKEYTEDYGLENFEFTSFFRITGYQSLLSASDTSYAVTALLECETAETASFKNGDADEDEQLMQAFNIAYDALNANQTPAVSLTGLSAEGSNLSNLVNGGNLAGNTGLGAGIRLAMSLQKSIIATATSLIERNAITRLSHFRYAYITCSSGTTTTTQDGGSVDVAGQDENTDQGGTSVGQNDHIFAKPLALTRLAHYLMDLNRENGKWTGNKARPLILLAEKRRTKTFMVVGYEYPETAGALVRNRFGKKFELAAQSMKGEFRFDSFDSNVVEVGRADVQRFVEQLHYLMDSL